MTSSSRRVVSGGPLPDFLTVEEAAAVLRIGRTGAYELARQFIRTDGGAGLPVIRIGKQLRVPRAALERWHGGPLTSEFALPTSASPVASESADGAVALSVAAATVPQARSGTGRRRASTPSAQLVLLERD